MKTRDGSTGDADEHEREDGQSRGMRISQPIGQLRQVWAMYEQHYQDSNRHEYQSDGKERIDLAYNFIDGKQRSENIIEKNDDDPEGHV